VTPEIVSAQRPQTVIVTFGKSSGLAVVLSFFWAGLGQVYNGQILKGIMMMIAQPFLLWAGTASTIFGGLVAAGNPNDAGGAGVLLGGLMALGAVAIWIYSMVNAYRTADQISRRPWRTSDSRSTATAGLARP
jgi:TM2 domain-containing membrane protein YozV